MAKKILVVDDDLNIRDVYAEVLKDAGYDIILAADGEQALSALKSHVFDLVLLDVIMPKFNGLEVLGQIRQDQKLKDVPVVMLTNFGQEEIAKKAMDLGAVDFIIKYNTTPGEAAQKINKILSP